MASFSAGDAVDATIAPISSLTIESALFDVLDVDVDVDAIVGVDVEAIEGAAIEGAAIEGAATGAGARVGGRDAVCAVEDVEDVEDVEAGERGSTKEGRGSQATPPSSATSRAPCSWRASAAISSSSFTGTSERTLTRRSTRRYRGAVDPEARAS